MNPEEWDRHWTSHGNQYLKQGDLRRLRAVLKPYLKGKIADLGCGLTDVYDSESDVTGLDISPECVKQMQERYPTGTWITGDVRDTGLPGSTFDTVLCSHVLEHFWYQKPIIEEMKRIVKPDGNIIIAVPRRSIGPDHVHPKWDERKVRERIAAYLKEATVELAAREHWLIQGKKTATATVVQVAWSPIAHRMKAMKQCMESLRRCTKYPYQWVVVDNGPAEQTEFIRQLGPDVHIVPKVNCCPPVGRNRGAGCANTDYVAFVDNDVLFYEDWLAEAIGILEKYGDRKLIVAPIDCRILRKHKTGQLDGYCLSSFGASFCWVMRRTTYEEVGPWNETDSVEDYDYSRRAIPLGYQYIYQEDGPVVRHLGLHHRTFQAFEQFVDGQWIPDPGDKRGMEMYKRMILREYAKRFSLDVFVETGTYKGDTVKAILLTALFKEIFTVDIDPTRAGLAQRRFRSFPFIHCDCADSGTWLPEMLKQIHRPALFWLDAHGSVAQAHAGMTTPIVNEIKAIMAHECAKDHVVLCDDARYYSGSVAGYPTLEELKALFPADCVFEVKADILRVHRCP